MLPHRTRSDEPVIWAVACLNVPELKRGVDCYFLGRFHSCIPLLPILAGLQPPQARLEAPRSFERGLWFGRLATEISSTRYD